MPQIDLIQLRRGESAEWTAVNPVLELAEPGFESDTGQLKIGDGATTWASLGYLAGGGGGGGLTPEQIRDLVADALRAGTNISIAYDDAADTITISASGVSTSRAITTTPPLGGGGDLRGDLNLFVSDFSAGARGTVPASGGGSANHPARRWCVGGTGRWRWRWWVPTARLVATTAPLVGGGDLSVDRTLSVNDFTVTTRGTVPNPGGTTTGRFLKDDGTWSVPPSGATGAGNVFPFTYNTSTLESITGNQIRGNNTTFANSTKLWVSEITVDGLDVTVGLSRIKAGYQVYVQDYTSAARYAVWNVTADAVDKGNYWELTVVPSSSAGTIPGGKVALQSLSASQASKLFSTTTTAPGLAPGSNGAATTSFLRADGLWAAPGSASAAIVQQPNAPADTTVLWADTDEVGIEENVRYLQNNTGTAYTLVIGDRGKLILCANAAAQVVTVPTNASVAFLVGTQIDLVQTGVGALSVAGAGGVTVSATPSLGFRAQYSAASLIKTGTNTWLLIGDLA